MSGAIVTTAHSAEAERGHAPRTTTDRGEVDVDVEATWAGRRPTLPGCRAHRRYGTPRWRRPQGPSSAARVHLTGTAALTIVGTIVGLIIARRMFVAAHRPLSWAAAACRRRGPPRPDRRPAGHAHPPGARRCSLTFLAHRRRRRRHHLPRVRRRAAGRRPPRDGRAAGRRPDRAPRRPARRGGRRTSTSTERVTSFTDALGKRVTGGDDVLRTTAGTAPSYLVCAILTVFLMTYGPRIAPRRPRAGPRRGPARARRRRRRARRGPGAVGHPPHRRHRRGRRARRGRAGRRASTCRRRPRVGLTAGVLALLPTSGSSSGRSRSCCWPRLPLGHRPRSCWRSSSWRSRSSTRSCVRRWIARRSVEHRPARPVGRRPARLRGLRHRRRRLRPGLRHRRPGRPRPASGTLNHERGEAKPPPPPGSAGRATKKAAGQEGREGRRRPRGSADTARGLPDGSVRRFPGNLSCFGRRWWSSPATRASKGPPPCTRPQAPRCRRLLPRPRRRRCGRCPPRHPRAPPAPRTAPPPRPPPRPTQRRPTAGAARTAPAHGRPRRGLDAAAEALGITAEEL